MRRAALPLLACLTLPFALPWAAAAEPAAREAPAVSPEINAYYKDADVARWKLVFESPLREVFDKRFRIVQAARVQPGMVVADVGAGTGFFAMLFARAVGPTGKVYAVDISDNFLAYIRWRAAEEYHVDNVETLLNDQGGTGLPPDGVDLVFLCETYHHLEHPRAMLDSIASALRPDGELILIDYRRVIGESSDWVLTHVRAGQDDVMAELLEAGFVLVEEQDFLRENYYLRFRKRSEEAGSPEGVETQGPARGAP
jgi:ubiquinone/menaquinone biosynthesis C-methylase UbiE